MNQVVIFFECFETNWFLLKHQNYFEYNTVSIAILIQETVLEKLFLIKILHRLFSSKK